MCVLVGAKVIIADKIADKKVENLEISWNYRKEIPLKTPSRRL
jgi:hypothetical protein